MNFEEIIQEIEEEYKKSYEEIVESGVFRDPLNYYLVCVYPIKPFERCVVNPQAMFTNFRDEIALYFHIPFCMKRCQFCNFTICVPSNENKDKVDKYLEALKKEAELVKEAFKNGNSQPKIHSIYIGGGTPTYLNKNQIKFLLEEIIYNNFSEYFPPGGLAELTMEASPGTLTEKKLKLMKGLGVSRVSIGIQTFDEDTLKLMNRDHNKEQSLKAINWLQEIFIESFNIDLIPGLPIKNDQPREFFFKRLFDDLNIVINQKIPSVTFYHLWTRGMEKTPMMLRVRKGEWILPSREEVVKLWIMINKVLTKKGYTQNPAGWFIKSDNSLFKQQIFKWAEKHEYLGLGVSAYGYFNNYIYWNVANINDYISRVSSGQFPYERIRQLSGDESLRKKAVFSIKTTQGLDLNKLNNPKFFKEEIEILKHLGLVEQQGNIIKLTSKGYIFFDEVSEFFFDEVDRESIRKKLDLYTIARNRLNFIIRKCIFEFNEKVKNFQSFEFKEKWEEFLNETLFPKITVVLEFFLKQILKEKYQRFLLVYLYSNEEGETSLLKPYYSQPNEWYREVILKWFEEKSRKNEAISLTQTLFEPPPKLQTYFPPPISFSLEDPNITPSEINVINLNGIHSEVLRVVHITLQQVFQVSQVVSEESLSQVFAKLYNQNMLNKNFLDTLYNNLKNIQQLNCLFSQIKNIILSKYPQKEESQVFKDLEQNPSKLLPSLLAFWGNNDKQAKHYLFIPLDVNEKCLPLGVVLELKKMIDDKEYEQVFKFFISTLPIITSFEERIRMEIKHRESLQHALRSAIAAIMSRNMSHNIGSHVLNYLSNPEELDNLWII